MNLQSPPAFIRKQSLSAPESQPKTNRKPKTSCSSFVSFAKNRILRLCGSTSIEKLVRPTTAATNLKKLFLDAHQQKIDTVVYWALSKHFCKLSRSTRQIQYALYAPHSIRHKGSQLVQISLATQNRLILLIGYFVWIICPVVVADEFPTNNTSLQSLD